MIDPIVVMKVRGDILHRLLENGVSAYPKLDGKFPIVSGIKFTFDSAKPPYQWINKEDIFIKGEPIDYSRTYLMSTKYFISTGKDGYVDFKDCEYVVDQHNGLIL